MAIYDVRLGKRKDVVLSFEANFSAASCPLVILCEDEDEGGERGITTPFQVADAHHYPLEAARMLNEWLRGEGAEAWEEEDDELADYSVREVSA